MSQIASPADLRRVMGTDYEVSEQQWRAISAPLEPAVVIAGAGSGKTSVMAARVVYLVVTGQVRPDQVLGLTFTTKAAGELRSRIREALETAGHGRGSVVRLAPEREDDPGAEELLEPVVATYNAYAASLLTEHGLRIGHEPDTRVIADAARYQLAGRVIERHTGRVDQLSDHPATVIKYLLTLDGAMAEHLVSPAMLAEFDAREWPRFEAALSGKPLTDVHSGFIRRGEALTLVREYRDLKRQYGLMDFSDQIALAARLATEHPDVGELERDKARIVLLDEYQDTSVAQAQLLSRLFSGPEGAPGRGHPVTAVGDPNQAIYGWRGASVSNILRFADDFPPARAPEAGQSPRGAFALTVNRRSDRRILQQATTVAGPLYRRFDQLQPLEPGREQDGDAQVIVHADHDQELVWLAEQVQQTHDDAVEAADQKPVEAWREIGVLVRDNAHAADVFDHLSAAGIPVEIVGLKGLLRLPEVADVLATLTLVSDLTANAELLSLLTGPRWAIGPRDLALLGRRARELSGARGREPETATRPPLDEALAQAVAGADPTEVTALSDALDDPGDLPYSEVARERFALLSGELRRLRGYAGEPLLELVRRIIDVCGIDVELAASVSEAARARRENLDLFVKAVAEFQAIDGAVTLPALLAWLEAEEEGEGLDVATPSTADSVKLLTIHRAKGLEWDNVFLVGMCEEKFPVKRIRGLWPTRVELLPTPLRGDARDLPALTGYDAEALKRLRADTQDHEAIEELRLAYVALTRARHRMVVSSYLWKGDRKSPLGPSPYQRTMVEQLTAWGLEPLAWLEKPEKGTPNPLLEVAREVPWPVTEQTAEALRRLEAAERVVDYLRPAGPLPEAPELDLAQLSTVAEWDEELERLLAEAMAERRDVVDVTLPTNVAATGLSRIRRDPAGFSADLARPMPRPPSPAARFGTRFHAWVESRFGQQDLIDPDQLPGRADAGIDDADDLRELIEAFEAGPFADRAPYRIEAPFALVLAGQVVRGRIDAVYTQPRPDGSTGFLVVDWKTGRRESSDPLQLAVYRLAWSELTGVPLERVEAAFHYVRSRHTDVLTDLPGRAELEGDLDSGFDGGFDGRLSEEPDETFHDGHDLDAERPPISRTPR